MWGVMITFWGQRIKGQEGHSETKCSFPAEAYWSTVSRRRPSVYIYFNLFAKKHDVALLLMMMMMNRHVCGQHDSDCVFCRCHRLSLLKWRVKATSATSTSLTTRISRFCQRTSTQKSSLTSDRSQTAIIFHVQCSAVQCFACSSERPMFACTMSPCTCNLAPPKVHTVRVSINIAYKIIFYTHCLCYI